LVGFRHENDYRLCAAEGVGDDGLAVGVMYGVEGFVAGCFLRGDGGVELAGGDLFSGGGDVTEFAGGEVAFGGAHGRTEGAADDGARSVKVAGAGDGVEDGAGLVFSDGVFGFVGEKGCVVVVFVEDAGGGIARE